MIEFRELGEAVENSVFGVLKKNDLAGPQRFVFSGDNTNKLLFLPNCGKTSLPSPDKLARIRLRASEFLYVATDDVSQCYKRLRVMSFMIPLFGIPRVWSKEVGLPGPGRFVVPCLSVLPMGVPPAVRITQAVTTTVVVYEAPPRLLDAQTFFAAGPDGAPLDVVYIEDVSAVGTDEKLVNARKKRTRAALEKSGLPTEEKKHVEAEERNTRPELLGLTFWREGYLSPTPAYLRALFISTSEVLENAWLSPRGMSRLVGSWVFACLLRRPILSFLYRVCSFMHSGDWQTSRRVPTGCLRELTLLIDLAPLMQCDLKCTVSDRVHATDACMSGGAVTYSTSFSEADQEMMQETLIAKGWQNSLFENHSVDLAANFWLQ